MGELAAEVAERVILRPQEVHEQIAQMDAHGGHARRRRILGQGAPVPGGNVGELVMVEIGLDVHDGAEHAIADEPPHLDDGRLVAALMADAQHHARRIARRYRPFGVGARQGQRLLAEHVLPRRRAGQHLGCVQRVRGAEDDGVDAGIAKRLGKTLMIHNRDADAELLRVLHDEGAPETVIFHCFSSDADMARACVDAGYVLSFSGTVSFRNAKALREAAPLVPREQVLVETDAPFLTPHPFRGAPNESYCLPYTLRALAEVRGEDPLELAAATTANAERVYGFPAI